MFILKTKRENLISVSCKICNTISYMYFQEALTKISNLFKELKFADTDTIEIR